MATFTKARLMSMAYITIYDEDYDYTIEREMVIECK